MAAEALQRLVQLEFEADECVQAILALAEGGEAGEAGQTPAEITTRASRALRELGAALADAQQAGEEADREEERARVLAEAARHERELRRLQGELRKANLRFRVCRERRAASERAELLSGGGQQSALRQRMRGSSAGLLRTSEDVTMSLERTHERMGQELERVASITAVLDKNADTLKDTIKEGDAIGGFVTRARKTITVLQRRETVDRVLNLCGLLLFLLVVLYIVKKRLSFSLF